MRQEIDLRCGFGMMFGVGSSLEEALCTGLRLVQQGWVHEVALR
jgi:hypothetical protein